MAEGHWIGCWNTPGHHACAINRIADLEQQLGAWGRKGGLVGGRRAIEKLTSEQRRQLAEMGGKARMALAEERQALARKGGQARAAQRRAQQAGDGHGSPVGFPPAAGGSNPPARSTHKEDS
jgi:hypothetical protein